jgi:hypothetical protein
VREKSNLLNGFNLIWAVQVSSQIYTSSLSPQISGYFRASRLDKRGVSRSSRTRGGMRWTRGVGAEVGCRAGQPVSGSRCARRTTPMRTAKPCGPGTRGWCQAVGGEFGPTGSRRHQAGRDGGKTNSSPGRARHKPSNHCAGNAGVFRLYLYARVRISMHTLHTRPRVQRAPGIPCTLRFRKEGTRSSKPRAQCVARTRSHICVGWVERSETLHP